MNKTRKYEILLTFKIILTLHKINNELVFPHTVSILEITFNLYFEVKFVLSRLH